MKERLVLYFLVGLGLVLLAYTAAHATPVPTPIIQPQEWDGITDNQGHTLTISSSGEINVEQTPTPTATFTPTKTPAPTATP